MRRAPFPNGGLLDVFLKKGSLKPEEIREEPTEPSLSSSMRTGGKAKARFPGCAVTQGSPSARRTALLAGPHGGGAGNVLFLGSRLFPRLPQPPEPLPGPAASGREKGFLCLSCQAADSSPARVSATAQRSKSPPQYQLRHRWRRLSEEEGLPKRIMPSPP